MLNNIKAIFFANEKYAKFPVKVSLKYDAKLLSYHIGGSRALDSYPSNMIENKTGFPVVGMLMHEPNEEYDPKHPQNIYFQVLATVRDSNPLTTQSYWVHYSDINWGGKKPLLNHLYQVFSSLARKAVSLC